MMQMSSFCPFFCWYVIELKSSEQLVILLLHDKGIECRKETLNRFCSIFQSSFVCVYVCSCLHVRVVLDHSPPHATAHRKLEKESARARERKKLIRYFSIFARQHCCWLNHLRIFLFNILLLVFPILFAFSWASLNMNVFFSLALIFFLLFFFLVRFFSFFARLVVVDANLRIWEGKSFVRTVNDNYVDKAGGNLLLAILKHTSRKASIFYWWPFFSFSSIFSYSLSVSLFLRLSY